MEGGQVQNQRNKESERGAQMSQAGEGGLAETTAG
jgi:hypothetical protein